MSSSIAFVHPARSLSSECFERVGSCWSLLCISTPTSRNSAKLVRCGTFSWDPLHLHLRQIPTKVSDYSSPLNINSIQHSSWCHGYVSTDIILIFMEYFRSNESRGSNHSKCVSVGTSWYSKITENSNNWRRGVQRFYLIDNRSRCDVTLTKMFSGFRSRWMIPNLCKYSNPARQSEQHKLTIT